MTKPISPLLHVKPNPESKILIDIISLEKTTSPEVKRYDILEYVEMMARELSDLVAQENLPLIACLLNMVAQEACDLKHESQSRRLA